VRRTLATRGLVEAVAFSFLSSRAAGLFGGAKPELRLVNPISADLDAMRPSALPGLVEAARRNADRGFPDLALFELGPAYRDDTPEGQMTVAAGLRAGRLAPRHWQQPPREPNLYIAKSDALAALAAMGAPADNIQTSADQPPVNCTRMCSTCSSSRVRSLLSRCFSTPCPCRAPAVPDNR